MSKVQKCTTVFNLSNGSKIPAIGLGTWKAEDQEVYDSVLAALKAGYRHIDTASGYGNEEPIGRAIKASGVPRSEIFITTKLWSTFHNNPEEALRTSLKKLDTSYVDLYLMHWPIALNPNGSPANMPLKADGKRDILLDWSFVKTWTLMEPLVEKGLAKSIGVSNCSVKFLTELLSFPDLKIKPAANQVELHPYLPQNKLLAFAKANNIVLEAYSPLGSSDAPLLKDETLNAIGEKYGVSAATIAISWAVWRGTVVLPKSIKPSRIESNFEIVDLADEDGETLNNLYKKIGGPKRFIHPAWDPINPFGDDD